MDKKRASGSANRPLRITPAHPDQFAGLGGVCDLPSELGVLDGPEDLLENRTRRKTHPDQIQSGQQAGRPELLFRILSQLLLAECIMIEKAVAPEAVEAVELQVKREIRRPKEAFEAVRPHLPYIHEQHVTAYEGENRLHLLTGEAESPEDRGRDLFPALNMAVEMGPGCIVGPGDRLADIVEENCPGKTRVGLSIRLGQQGDHPQRMLPDIPLGMKNRGLFDTPKRMNFWNDFNKKTAFGQEFQAAPRRAARQQPGELVANPLGADPHDHGRPLSDGRKGQGLDRKAERRRETDRPEHPQVILGKALLRIADCADDPLFNVAETTHMIDDSARLRIHEETVDRKIPPPDVLLRSRKGDPGRTAAVIVVRFHPKGGHLVRRPPLDDEAYAKALADGDRPGKEPPDLFRPGRCDNIVVRRRLAAKEIPDAAAHPEGLMTGLPQSADNFSGRISWHVQTSGHNVRFFSGIGRNIRLTAAISGE